jgi:protein involved in polysaccharide export with SLBB domain
MNPPPTVVLKIVALIQACALATSGVAFAEVRHVTNAQSDPLSFAAQAQAPAQAPAEIPANDYVLGEEDEIEISVYGNDDLEKTQAVRPGGYITFPLVGSIRASGRTPEQLREQITSQLSAYVRNPQVTVIVRAYNSRKVSVLGEVKAPGLHRISSNISVLEALSRAGGMNEDADLRGTLVLRGQQIVPVDFTRLLKQGDPTQNIPLQPGDVILVPNLNEKKVFVLGQVRTPQVVPLAPNLSVIEAISRAGGLTDDADLSGAMVVRSGSALPVSFDRLMRGSDLSQNILLQADDTILVPNIKDKKVFILGTVRSPLVATLKPGTTLVEAISMAGGFADGARTSNILVVRGGLGNPTLMTVNFNDIVDGRPEKPNTLLESGDIVYVPRTAISNVARFFQDISSIVTPFVLAESGYIIASRTGTVQNVVVAPQ